MPAKPRIAELEAALARLRRRHAERRRRVLETPQQPCVRLDGRALLSFCSNDYLGLANHPEVVAALRDGATRWGVGSGAAHLVTGHSAAHAALEEELAGFTGRDRALLFSTGYMANLGVIATLCGRDDTIWQDRLNHASLLDAAVLARGRLRRYPHADAGALARQLADQTATLIATDGVFSMDGDLAPLPELAALAERAGAWLLVDDAHGLGVLGEEGRGTLAHYGLDAERVPLLMGTLGKAFGTCGAFVAGSETLIETLIQRARSYIYTTAMPPALAEATRVSLAIARREGWRRTHLQILIKRLRSGANQLGLPLSDSPTAIQPLIAGSSEQALRWAAELETRGILVTAIRPPTVPAGKARLRICLSAAHTEAMVDRLLEALSELPLEPSPPAPSSTTDSAAMAAHP
ncbi:8-amino-7-oxononanoate synthase [Thiocapsa imhoffii]|uniref:8-amino-7-oxononanoate synthase n=1 Tax=Thiocapsa imhoffii TaxID=382777 RepID=A0A9X0WIK3_9GAMM|nr:8-amino-7-oxononanoate synthase [Thiocapsa imhoffii]MBK1645417.1 8-amino-7-oxononanoate synthase [Thiocapsa imhoffii]